MYSVTTKAEFDAAHFLAGYPGKCKNLHGHRWSIEATLKGEELDELGMLVDFTDIKRDLKEICDNFDHSLIMKKDSLKPATLEALMDEGFKINIMDFMPTAEGFAKFFFEELEKKNYPIVEIKVYETPKNYAIYTK
ncbi:6-carboxytetrahydropterin synthase QueD [Lachnospira multipara]|uniref:6-carboxy-5,6,7,8-tetrahydropterin synthase n=1 Tax=Lachnospira multipara TaxID=28051 RepID=A0A1H5UE47_9FIRM|nr:6-carboxytetrahydropterin synthase QueD [Lachnospira multipara]SEF73314.1 6-pyruvoyltetrahydropterin/6-carboxytetrahydropterin synthase [Lachnospira multipara]